MGHDANPTCSSYSKQDCFPNGKDISFSLFYVLGVWNALCFQLPGGGKKKYSYSIYFVATRSENLKNFYKQKETELQKKFPENKINLNIPRLKEDLKCYRYNIKVRYRNRKVKCTI